LKDERVIMKLIYRTAAPHVLMGAILWVTPISAKDITVQMRNQGAAGMMVFEPGFVQAKVGDTVHFVPTDLGHNAETIPGILPDGVEPSKGAISKEFVLRLSKPGLYGVRCMPHYSMGMVALVQAGKGPSANLAAARSATLPPMAAKRLAPYLAQAK
jgi:pseudoazurin